MSVVIVSELMNSAYDCIRTSSFRPSVKLLWGFKAVAGASYTTPRLHADFFISVFCGVPVGFDRCGKGVQTEPTTAC
eukprot:7900789-Pyramimonas_sp.AAC.1